MMKLYPLLFEEVPATFGSFGGASWKNDKGPSSFIDMTAEQLNQVVVELVESFRKVMGKIALELVPKYDIDGVAGASGSAALKQLRDPALRTKIIAQYKPSQYSNYVSALEFAANKVLMPSGKEKGTTAYDELSRWLYWQLANNLRARSEGKTAPEPYAYSDGSMKGWFTQYWAKFSGTLVAWGNKKALELQAEESEKASYA